ncbi:MAG: hypothetical protein CMA72_07330 [Euryarchaeota archaeon]|nr:hypothetical protein [Euryarchaeota archaeon]
MQSHTTHTQHKEREMNPFELRYQVLRDAKDMMYEQWHANRDKSTFDTAPTAKEIKDLAAELYEFVSKRD